VDRGKVCVAVRYGNKITELAKGKAAAQTTAGDIGNVLNALRKAV